MSTKIYNGIIFNNLDIEGVFNEINRWRHIGEKIQTEALNKYIISYAVLEVLDRNLTEGRKCDGNALSLGCNYVNEILRESERTGRICPLDYKMEITLHPSGCDTLGILFCNSELKNAFMKINAVNEFAYWNNCDEPDGMPPVEWNTRGVRWENAIGWDSPGLRGLTATVNTTMPQRYIGVSNDEINTALNDIQYENRITTCIDRMLMDDKSIWGGDKIDDGGAGVFEERKALSKWKKSNEGTKAVSFLRKQVVEKIPYTYKADDLMKDVMEDA